jgi:hypothetical protein
LLTALGGLARVVQGPIPEARQIYANLRLTPICQPEERPVQATAKPGLNMGKGFASKAAMT